MAGFIENNNDSGINNNNSASLNDIYKNAADMSKLNSLKQRFQAIIMALISVRTENVVHSNTYKGHNDC